MDATDYKQDRALQPQDPQSGIQIRMQVEDGEIMCVKVKEEEIPADISPNGSNDSNTPERHLRLRYSLLNPDKEIKEERLNIVLGNTDPVFDGDSSYLDNKEDEIPIDFSSVASEPLGNHSRVVKSRTRSKGRASTFSHTRKRPSASRMSDSRGYIEVNSLITAVSHQPAIWDARDPSYMDRLKRSHAWERVCQDVTEDWDDLHTKTQDLRLKDLQTRWRSLKDCYRRELQQQRKAEKSGGPAVKRKTYLYFRQLHFLKPVLEARRQVWKQKSGDCLSGNLREKAQEAKLEPKSSVTSAAPRSSATSLPIMDSSHLEQPPKRRRQEKQSICALNSPITTQEVDREHQELEKDADYHFYMYIMAVTKKFSPEKKWAFRMKIMELLQMHSLDQQAPSSYSPHLTYTPEAHDSPSTYPPAYAHYYPDETSHPHISKHSPTYIPPNHQHSSSDPSILPAPASQPHSPIESPYRSPLSRSSQTPSSQASLDTEGDSSFLDY
ncbi:uncharacterized protein LOC130282826 [Hyla sarda]|uniref:uncharacterized protein LOC130282826 n=1 Tax=Hyla sarda TaxID=327740 RepID=UPI0024C33EEC|nr:uncharacterized protein LOC130282826 [Hyla sarda]